MSWLSRPIWEDLPQIKCQASVLRSSSQPINVRFASWILDYLSMSLLLERGKIKEDDCGPVSLPLEGSGRQRTALAQLPSHLPKTRKDQRWPGTKNYTTRCSCFLDLPCDCHLCAINWRFIVFLLFVVFLDLSSQAFAKRVDFCSFATASKTFVRCTLGGCHGAHLRCKCLPLVVWKSCCSLSQRQRPNDTKSKKSKVEAKAVVIIIHCCRSEQVSISQTIICPQRGAKEE